MNNSDLEKTIIKFITNKLGLYDKKSIINTYLLSNNLDIFEEQATVLYGVLTKISNVEFNIFNINLDENNNIIFVKGSDLPSYAIYIDIDNNIYKLFCKTNSMPWMSANTLLQASFLAGMEQLHQSHPKYSISSAHKLDKGDVITILDLVGSL